MKRRSYLISRSVLGGLLGTIVYFAFGWQLFSSDAQGYLLNWYTELGGIVITILVLNVLVRQREQERWLQQTMIDASSPVQAVAVTAVRNLYMQRYLAAEARHPNAEPLSFEGANWEGVSLEGVYLAGANLTRVDLRGGSLQNAELQGSILRQATLIGTDLQLAKLVEAELYQADASGAKLGGANLSQIKAQEIRLNDTNLESATLREADLRGARLTKARLQRADLRGANLSGADLRGAKLDAAKLQGAIFDPQTYLPDGQYWYLGQDMTAYTSPATAQ